MRRRREDPASPPAAFPVYGLDGWPGARWLDGFGDAIGEPVRWVRLAHQDARTGALLMVETCARSPTDAKAAQVGVDPLRAVAFDAAALLVNLTLPADSVPRPEGMLRALVEHADLRSGQHAQWPPVAWRVDGAAVAARVWRFADGWAAVSEAAAGVYLAVVGAGPVPPDDLELTALRDGRGYGFELDQPLSQKVLGAVPGGRPPLDRRPDWHADQTALLRESAEIFPSEGWAPK